MNEVYEVKIHANECGLNKGSGRAGPCRYCLERDCSCEFCIVDYIRVAVNATFGALMGLESFLYSFIFFLEKLPAKKIIRPIILVY